MQDSTWIRLHPFFSFPRATMAITIQPLNHLLKPQSLHLLPSPPVYKSGKLIPLLLVAPLLLLPAESPNPKGKLAISSSVVMLVPGERKCVTKVLLSSIDKGINTAPHTSIDGCVRQISEGPEFVSPPTCKSFGHSDFQIQLLCLYKKITSLKHLHYHIHI